MVHRHIRRCSLDREPEGAGSVDGGGACWEIGIHIADLSSFVKPGSALEAHAAARGTTTYLPTSNLPMVPRKLSENLCSLRGGADRRTFSVLIRLDDTGQPLAGSQSQLWFGPSVVRSRGKIPYEVAQEVLEEDRKSASVRSPLHTLFTPAHTTILLVLLVVLARFDLL